MIGMYDLLLYAFVIVQAMKCLISIMYKMRFDICTCTSRRNSHVEIGQSFPHPAIRWSVLLSVKLISTYKILSKSEEAAYFVCKTGMYIIAHASLIDNHHCIMLNTCTT